MSKVKLAIRVRPFTENEIRNEVSHEAVVDVLDDHTVTITNIKVSVSGAGDSRERVRRYNADYTFNSACPVTHNAYASQEKVFGTIGREVLDSLSRGMSACVLAYGQSATGKTYTMIGTETKPGLIPSLCRALGQETPCDITISFLEIYNERVHDLLVNDLAPVSNTCHSLPRRRGNQRKNLRVREHPSKGPYVQNLRRVAVHDVDTLLSVIAEGTRRRRTAATRRNCSSSRSHALLELVTPNATLHLADLAGSEKANWEGCGGGRQKEGANINKSLVALSNVISALVNGGTGRCRFVPYRDSALTWLLKDCFTGGANIFIIATVSPSAACYGESASTLRWTAQARQLTPRTRNPVGGVTSRAALHAQLNQLISELAKHHIQYIPESGNIIYDERHWNLGINKSLSTAKIGNIMNKFNPKADEIHNTETRSVSSDVINTIDVATEIHNEVDKLFGQTLERTKSGSDLEVIAPMRHNRRQYRSQEVLPVDTTINKGIRRLSDASENLSEIPSSGVHCSDSVKSSHVPILYDNQRAEIVASVTDRLYSKFKKDGTAPKTDSAVEKKLVQPLSELRICTNARQRLVELSQRALRNKRRIGIPAHTQTRKQVTLVKEKGIDVQTDLGPFVIQNNNSQTLYHDVSTETVPMIPRLKEIAIGDGSLNFNDRSTTMEVKKIYKRSCSMMTDILQKRDIYTQTQVIPTTRKKQRVPMQPKLHKKIDRRQKSSDCVTPPVININISPFYSLDSESVSSDENFEKQNLPHTLSNFLTPPDLLTNHRNTDNKLENPKSDGNNCSKDLCNEKNIEINRTLTPPLLETKASKDFSDTEDYILPRVTIGSTEISDRNDYKNLILGRNKDLYPYNIVVSPVRDKGDGKKSIKFQDDDISITESDSEAWEKKRDCCSSEKFFYNSGNEIRNLTEEVSDTSDYSKVKSDIFVWKNINKDKSDKSSKNLNRQTAYTNKFFLKSAKSKDHEDVFGFKNNDRDALSLQKCNESRLMDKTHSGVFSERPFSAIKYNNNFVESNALQQIECKLEESCNSLDRSVNKYQLYLAKYSKGNDIDNENEIHIRSPTEYLRYLVKLRREAVNGACVTTDSTETFSSS